MSFIAVGGTLLVGGTIGAGTIAAGAGLLGTAASLYGANKQAHDTRAANTTNQVAVDKANQNEWNNYLLTRGVNTGGNAPYGSIPTNYTPVNTRLPLWATMNAPAQSTKSIPGQNTPFLIKKSA